MPPALSVIVPAHNEAVLIGGTLDALRRQLEPGDEVIVVANGCVDDTVGVSRTALLGVDHRVLDLDRPSKAAALNAGDALARWGRRLYLDADVTLSPGVLSSVRRALGTERPVLVSVRADFDTRASSRLVRSFYRVVTLLAARSDLVVGGAYAVNGAGRARFPGFSDLIADDHFVKLHFSAQERVMGEETIVVRAPADLRNLVRVRTRIVKGNREVGRRAEGLRGRPATTRSSAGRLGDAIRHREASIADVLAYVLVVSYARVRALLPGLARWEVDASARRPGLPGPASAGPSPP